MCWLILTCTFNQRWGCNQWKCPLQGCTGMKTCRHVVNIAKSYFQRQSRAARWWESWADWPLLDMSPEWGHSVASGTLGHFPSEEQQVLWPLGIFPLCNAREVMFFQTLRMFWCFSSSPACCINTALQLWKYSEAHRGISWAIEWTIEENMSLILHRLVTWERKGACNVWAVCH